MKSHGLPQMPMSSDPPFIVSSEQPFKVQATPSKRGGVDALAKRPLDMSGQAQQNQDHLESVPADGVPPDTRVTLPSQGLAADTRVTIPLDAPGGMGGEGPVLQEQFDTSHREYFDDPSRYLRTDVVVKVPRTGSPPPAGAVVPHPQGPAGATPLDPVLPGVTPTDRMRSRKPRKSWPASQPGSPARADAPLSSPTPVGTPKQRRDAFNQRLANIISHQQHIREELSAVEQAVQASRAALDPDADRDQADDNAQEKSDPT